MVEERIITKAELDEHSYEDDYWVAVNGIVYDMTNFNHVGGPWPIQKHAGRDASISYSKKHKDNRIAEGTEKYDAPPQVGVLEVPPPPPAKKPRAKAAPKPKATPKPKAIAERKAAPKPKPKATPKVKVPAKPKAVPKAKAPVEAKAAPEPRARPKRKAAPEAKTNTVPKKPGKGALPTMEKAEPAKPKGKPKGVVKKKAAPKQSKAAPKKAGLNYDPNFLVIGPA